MPSLPSPPLGQTQSFVLARGFEPLNDSDVLVGHDGQNRLFAELTADPDRPDTRPQEAYQALLSALQPGWHVRLLQICWPDPVPRQTFLAHVQGWPFQAEGLELLRQGLVLCMEEAPLPFLRQTYLEFVYPGEEGQAWWDGTAGLLANFGLTLRPLGSEEVIHLAQHFFNPVLD